VTGLVLDLFCGVGVAVGLRALGLEEVGIDADPAVCATRRAVGLATVRADVARYPAGHLAGRVRGLWASPPCPVFSSAGNGHGRHVLDLLGAAAADQLAGRPPLAAAIVAALIGADHPAT